MTYDTLISVEQLAAALDAPGDGAPLVLDCSFELGNPPAGQRTYEAGRIASARYVHLDEVLSTAKTGLNGRHPLPARADFAASMAALGAGDETQIVVYDGAGGMYAARAWWMLRWAGHRAVALLDGGTAAWVASGRALSTGPLPPPVRGSFSLRPALVTAVDYAGLCAHLASGERLVVDARAPDRFRGENETLDPVGGRIPGARNRLFRNNLAPDGRFKPAAQLREEFAAVLGTRSPSEVVSQCGSGVTACHNLLAMELAGLTGATLYPGSWSEWCAQPGAGIATGPAD